MTIARFVQLIGMLAGLIAVSLGMATYTHADFTNIHMLFGLLVALSLLVLAALGLFTSEIRRLGAIGLVYAFIVPIFGVTQQMILMGELHWLIEAAHLLVGGGALALIGIISTRLTQRKIAEKEPVAAMKMPQAAR